MAPKRLGPLQKESASFFNCHLQPNPLWYSAGHASFTANEETSHAYALRPSKEFKYGNISSDDVRIQFHLSGGRTSIALLHKYQTAPANTDSYVSVEFIISCGDILNVNPVLGTLPHSNGHEHLPLQFRYALFSHAALTIHALAGLITLPLAESVRVLSTGTGKVSLLQ
jgi:hypothetical protein